MNSRPYQHRTILLKTGFQYEQDRLFFTRARLFPDRIELSGWHPGGQRREVIPLDRVSRVEWQREPSHKWNAVLHLEDGSARKLSLQNVEQWKHNLSERLRWVKPTPKSWTLDLPLKELIAYTTSMS